MGEILGNAAGGLIASQAQSIISLVLSRIGEEIKLGFGLKKDLQKLERELKRLNWLLEGAAKNPIQLNNLLMKDWLKMVKETAYNSKDLIDECSYCAVKRRLILSNQGKIMTKIRIALYLSTSVLFRFQMAHRVRDMIASIRDLYDDAHKLGIRPVEVAPSVYHHGGMMIAAQDLEERRLLHRQLWVDDEGLVGRDDIVAEITGILCDPGNSSRIITEIQVVGLGGVGKAAIVKRVARTQEVQEYFNSQVFLLEDCFGSDSTDILTKMAEKLFGSPLLGTETLTGLVEKIRERLSGQRYLLIMYDVWNNLKNIEYALEGIRGGKGSCLLLTCRTHIQSYMNQYIIQIQPLNEDESWSLFIQRLGENIQSTSATYEIAKTILKRCGGLPLAIRAVGDMLRLNQSIEMWREIAESKEWIWGDNLALSCFKVTWNCLPNIALKNCFSYCAIFRSGEVIEKEKIIQMWMAQDLLQPYEKMELIGNKYFDILLNSSFFHKQETDTLGNVMTFKIHGLVMDLACHIASEESTGDDTVREVRHISTIEKLNPELCKKLLTCYCNNAHLSSRVTRNKLEFLRCANHLRVLCLNGLGLEELPQSIIGSLKLLRYLDISENSFHSLPDAIVKIHLLQTLRIDRNTITKLQCSLVSKEIRNLVNLRHFCANFVDIGILNGLGNLTALQTISAINLENNWGGRVSELGSLNNLRGTLDIKGLDKIDSKEEASTLSLGSKLNVDGLTLRWAPKSLEISGHNEIFEALQPHNKVASLKVQNYGGTRYPPWLMSMTAIGGSPLMNIASLEIRDCVFAKGDLNLENLTSLRILSVLNCHKLTVSFPDQWFQCCRSIEVMIINGVDNVNTLPDLSPLSHLHELHILNSGNTIFELIGLSNLPKIREVKTDKLLPSDLSENSPLCKPLRALFLQAQGTTADALPVQLQHLTAVQDLQLKDFKKLKTLPEWLGYMTSVQTLRLENMPKLKLLPSQDAMKLLSKLKTFQIIDCTLLENQFTERREEWFKLAHVPYIYSNEVSIFHQKNPGTQP